MLKRLVRIATAIVTSDQESLFRARYELNYLWGAVIEARLMRSSRRSDRSQVRQPEQFRRRDGKEQKSGISEVCETNGSRGQHGNSF
jgi:hypothetical protein